MTSQNIVVAEPQNLAKKRLKTKRQWRKERYRRVKKGEQPAAYLNQRYKGRQAVMEIATDGTVTERSETVLKSRRIPLYSIDQTVPFKRICPVLLRDAYCRYYVDDGNRERYGWWSREAGEWKWCRGYLSDEKVRLHIKGDEVYAVIGGTHTCFAAIDADYHGGDHGVFRDQVALVLGNLHGHDGWHYSISPRGLHIIRTHRKTATSKARADLRKLLEQIDAQDADLRQRALAAGLKPISDWEIFPDPKQAFRLPLAAGRAVLLDKPYPKISLREYVDWQAEPKYGALDDALGAIFGVIKPSESQPPKAEANRRVVAEAKHATKNVFGPLKGRYAQVLVDFWTGKHCPPDSLNQAIVLTARMLPYYFPDPEQAVEFVEELIDKLPSETFSDRLAGGQRKEVSRVVRKTVQGVYDNNGHQRDPELSSNKLNKVFTAWQRKRFSLTDRSTWDKCAVSNPNQIAWTDSDGAVLKVLAQILKADVDKTADATAHLLQQLINQPSKQISIKYLKQLLSTFGIKCGHHGKANNYLRALKQEGWIDKVMGHAVGRSGRRWCVGERMMARFATFFPTNTTKPLPYLYYLCPIIKSDPTNNVVQKRVNNFGDNDADDLDEKVMQILKRDGSESDEEQA